MAAQRQQAVRACYEAGLAQIRQGMQALSQLHAELEAQDGHPHVRATLLKLLHDLDEVLLRETTPPPDFTRDGEGPADPMIAPHLEAGEDSTLPEAGG
jgi:hypothetical protein